MRHWCHLWKGRQCKNQNVIFLSSSSLHIAGKCAFFNALFQLVVHQDPCILFFRADTQQSVISLSWCLGAFHHSFDALPLNFMRFFVSPFPQLVELTLRGEEIGEAWQQTLSIKSEGKRNSVLQPLPYLLPLGSGAGLQSALPLLFCYCCVCREPSFLPSYVQHLSFNSDFWFSSCYLCMLVQCLFIHHTWLVG